MCDMVHFCIPEACVIYEVGIPIADAFPEPYLSDKAPKRGEPIPIIKTCNAAPKLNTSLPVFR